MSDDSKNKDGKDNEWNFEVDDKDFNSITKRINLEDLREKSQNKEPQEIAIDYSHLKRKKTLINVKQIKKQEEKLEQKTANIKLLRLMAFSIDMLVILFFSVFMTSLSNMVINMTNTFVKKYALFEFINTIPKALYPFILSYIIFSVLPSSIFNRSLGKILFRLYIGSSIHVERTPTFFKLFARELIAKPLSIISVFGVVLPFFSNYNFLHDSMTDTTVYND